MASDVFDVIIRGETRELAAAVNTARSGLGALRSAVANTGSIVRAFGLEQTAAGRAIESATTAIYASTAALQSMRAGLIAARGAGLAFIGTAGALAVAVVGVAVATERASRRLDEHLGSLRQLSSGYRGWARVAEEVSKRVTIAMEGGFQAATEALVQMNLFERQQAEEAAQGQQARFLAESARIEQAKREAVAAAKTVAAERKRAAEEAAEAVQAALSREMDDIAAYNIWQRDQWQAAADFRKQKFLEEAGARQGSLDAELDVIVQFNIWQRQQWEQAAEQRKRLFDEETRAAQKALDEELDTIVQFNIWERKQAEAAAEAHKREFEATAEAARRAAEEAVRPWLEFRDQVVDALVDVLSGVRDLGDAVRAVINDLMRLLARYLLRLAFPFLFAEHGAVLQNASVITAQRGAVFTRPTLAAIAERPGMTELALPLPPGLRPEALAAAIQGGRQPIDLNLQLAVVFDPSQIPPPPPEYVQAVVIADISRRGPTIQAIKVALA